MFGSHHVKIRSEVPFLADGEADGGEPELGKEAGQRGHGFHGDG